MNKRVAELIKQATTEVNPDGREWVFRKVDQEKLVELIVRECGSMHRQSDGPDAPC